MSEKTITYAQLLEHNKKDNLWALIHGKVYDVTKFLDEHPGGDEVILSEAGKDATEAFEDVGHSDEARELLPGMLVGEFEKDSLKTSKVFNTSSSAVDNAVQQGSNVMYFVPLALLGAYFAWRFYGA
ncbi:cytochrome b5 [Dentipellis sp. KUC8613]|nr:cytochrome b5 [Dentipellis sp. KUC8613]